MRAVLRGGVVVIGAHVVDGVRIGDRAFDERRVEAVAPSSSSWTSGTWVFTPSLKNAEPTVAYQRSSSSLPSSRRISEPTRIWPQPNDHGRSHGCLLPSTRFTSSSEKNRHVMSSPICARTSRIQTDVW